MTLLEKIIEEKLLKDVINLVGSLEGDIEHHLLPILSIEINKKEIRHNIHKIKLEYYKRNLTILEIILEKQKTLDNLRLVLKIVRENLDLQNISPFINLYNLYFTYRKKKLYTYITKEFILYEPQEYYQIERLLDLSIE